MRRIVWTAPSLADLRAIELWLEQNASTKVAFRTLLTIRERATFLQDFPSGGRLEGDGMRALRVYRTPYLILYRMYGGDVEVIRIRHERENWQSVS
jgi:toxin ParE1/3/4